MKDFYQRNNVGSAKYTINYNNGISKHKDGSAFYNINIFKNKKKMNLFVQKLLSDGYVER